MANRLAGSPSPFLEKHAHQPADRGPRTPEAFAEGRPDDDAIYMTGTQTMTGEGGWPMTVFATPDGEPFYCGTYFPAPAFVRLVRAVAEAWRDNRDAVRRQSAAVVDAISQASAHDLPAGELSAGV